MATTAWKKSSPENPEHVLAGCGLPAMHQKALVVLYHTTQTGEGPGKQYI
jgi:hypothetical protein